MINFLTLKMWFDLYPGSLQPVFQYALITLVIAFFIAVFVSYFYYKKYKKTLYAKIWLSIYNFCLTGAIIGVFILFFTFEAVPFLSARFWFLVWFLVHAVWAWFIYKKLKKLPEIKEEIKNRKEYKKYIP